MKKNIFKMFLNNYCLTLNESPGISCNTPRSSCIITPHYWYVPIYNNCLKQIVIGYNITETLLFDLVISIFL